VEYDLPEHVTSTRRDGRKEVLLHRSMAVIGPERIEIKSSRATMWLPLVFLLASLAVAVWMGTDAGGAPFWLLAALLFALLLVVPVSVMSLVSSIAGADVVADARKGSITWQQGYLGMGIGTKELVPFGKIAHLEITVEGAEPDRWRDQPDALRQFAIILQKQNGKRLVLARVPVPAGAQADGMDRALAVANAVAALTGTTVRLPEGWELVEIDTATGEPVSGQAAAPASRPPSTRRRSRRRA
jgi:membrane protein YdbS with pleckstrin-like domain